MTNQDIFEIMSRFERSGIRTMKLSKGDFSIELSKDMPCAQAVPDGIPASSPALAAKETPAITAPLAGVFYAASEPGSKPFVTVGDRVRKGDTVCLMEAMKMISEIPAPCDCIITEIIKENASLAAYGEALMRYQPC